MDRDIENIKQAVVRAIEQAKGDGSIVIINELHISVALGGGAKVVTGDDNSVEQMVVQDSEDRDPYSERGPIRRIGNGRMGACRDRAVRCNPWPR